VIIGIFSKFSKVFINKNWFALISPLYEIHPILPKYLSNLFAI
jgi:hypothetical protein